ncbi:MAG: hypothetical protein IJU76_14095 [Desulfovibrionaceae bacterium]|nr:hypothetical protein [Desulfovibrionaceae bacterium]
MPNEIPEVCKTLNLDSSDRTDLDTEEISKKHAYNEISYSKQKHEEDLLNSRQIRIQRKDYAEKIFYLICVWLAAVVLIVWQSGRRYLWLSDAVLITLITTTTATIIGLMVIVCNYIFPRHVKAQPPIKKE